MNFVYLIYYRLSHGSPGLVHIVLSLHYDNIFWLEPNAAPVPNIN
jgi:hypothetical protein